MNEIIARAAKQILASPAVKHAIAHAVIHVTKTVKDTINNKK